MVQIWEQGEGKANSFLLLCKAPAWREQAQSGGRAQGPPGMFGHCWKEQMETGGCTEAGGEISMGGWRGVSDAVAMSCCAICSGMTACAGLGEGTVPSLAQKRFAKILPLPWIQNHRTMESFWFIPAGRDL